MKVKYEFLTGEVVEVEVDDSVGEMIVELDRVEYNNDHKETRRHCTLSVKGDDGHWLVDNENNPDNFVPEQEEVDCKLKKALDSLTENQRDVVIAVHFMDLSLTDYAARRGISKQSAHERLVGAMKKMKKVL